MHQPVSFHITLVKYVYPSTFLSILHFKLITKRFRLISPRFKAQFIFTRTNACGRFALVNPESASFSCLPSSSPIRVVHIYVSLFDLLLVVLGLALDIVLFLCTALSHAHLSPIFWIYIYCCFPCTLLIFLSMCI